MQLLFIIHRQESAFSEFTAGETGGVYDISISVGDVDASGEDENPFATINFHFISKSNEETAFILNAG